MPILVRFSLCCSLAGLRLPTHLDGIKMFLQVPTLLPS